MHLMSEGSECFTQAMHRIDWPTVASGREIGRDDMEYFHRLRSSEIKLSVVNILHSFNLSYPETLCAPFGYKWHPFVQIMSHTLNIKTWP